MAAQTHQHVVMGICKDHPSCILNLQIHKIAKWLAETQFVTSYRKPSPEGPELYLTPPLRKEHVV